MSVPNFYVFLPYVLEVMSDGQVKSRKEIRNESVIKREIPNDEQHIKHILENQVYGFAPTEIIYNIAVNFIFGELDNSICRKNFVHVDTTAYAKNGTLQELVNEKFGK